MTKRPSEPALGNECAHPTGPCPGQFCSCGCRKCRPDLYVQPDGNESLPNVANVVEGEGS